MKFVFASFASQIPAASRAQLEPMLGGIPYFDYPADRTEINKIHDGSRVVLIVHSASVEELVQLAAKGFEHCIQQDRADFIPELLASCFMISRPAAFLKNPIPFLFNGATTSVDIGASANLSLSFRTNVQKPAILEKLREYLEGHHKLGALTDLCVQVADEMVMNAIFNAPVDLSGKPLYLTTSRSSTVTLPNSRASKLFASFSKHRVVIGCQDVYGSIDRELILNHLSRTFAKTQTAARSTGEGAGLGLKYMLQNSANFYIYCDKGVRTLVACGFLLNGMKANLAPNKHLHISLR